MSENQVHRDACQRQHRLIGNYLAMEAWVRGLECLVLIRTDLERFLGLQRFKSTRVQWLRADLKPWFPHQVPYYRTGAPSSIHSLFLSRVAISKYLPKGSMTTDDRIKGIDPSAPATARFSRSSKDVPAEADILSYLTILAAGLEVPPSKKALAKKAGAK